MITGIPANITQDTDPDRPNAVVNWTQPTASDNSGSVTLRSSHVSGETFPIGVTIVTYTAVDDDSNMIMEPFAIEIEGTRTCSFLHLCTDSLLLRLLFIQCTSFLQNKFILMMPQI